MGRSLRGTFKGVDIRVSERPWQVGVALAGVRGHFWGIYGVVEREKIGLRCRGV